MKLRLKAKAALLVVAISVAQLAAVGFAQDRLIAQDYVALLQAQQDTLTETFARDLADKLDLQLAVLEQSARLVDAATLSDPALRRDFLSRVSAARPVFDAIALIDLDGNVLDNEPQTARTNIAGRAAFGQLLASGSTVTSEPVLGQAGRGPLVMMLTPVHGADGRLIGVAGGAVHLLRQNLLGRLARERVGHTGHFEIVTRGPGAVYVAHADASRVLAPVAADSVERLRAAGDLVSRRDVRGRNWELRAVLPAADVELPMAQARRRGLLLMIAMCLVTAALVWFGVSRLLRPLSVLHATIRGLREAPGADLHVDTRSSDERGDLAREFEALMHELRARQAELAAVSEASPIGMFRTDRSGHITYANDAYLRQQGLPREEAGQGWLTLVRPEIRDSAWREWQTAIAGPTGLEVVRRLTRRDGSSILVALRSAPLVIAGRVEGHVGTVIDITDQAAAEKALRLLNAIFDSTTDYVVQTNAHGRIVYLNAALRRALGMTPEQAPDRRHYAAIHSPDGERRFATEIAPAVAEHGVWVGEASICLSDGQQVPVSKLVIAHRDKTGRIDHYSAIMRNIAAEVAAQRTLQLQASTLHSVTEAIPATVAVLGHDLRYRFVNGAFERWVRQRREDIVGRTMTEVHGDEEAGRRRPWAERALLGEAAGFELSYGGGASLQVLALNFIPLRLASGAVDGFVSVAQDITQHRQNEDRLRNLAHRDALTGLLNRAGFEQQLAACLRDGQGPRLALLYIDLDHFKAVNDTHGHGVGDEVLCQFANRLVGLVRPTDAVVRFGGDEFAVLLVGVREIGNAEMVADKVIDVAQTPFRIGSLQVTVGASVGVALGVAANGDWQDLVARADGMLYRAKQGGRGRSAVALH